MHEKVVLFHSMMKTIVTQEVNCKDCHRCVRICPVKAIGIVKGHAELVEEKCVLCGRCVVECPQHAKQVSDVTQRILQAREAGRPLVLTLAPSFISAFPEYSQTGLLEELRSVGFQAVEETAEGATVVSAAYRDLVEETHHPVISSCCPVTVKLLEQYYPALVGYLAPVLSPMLVHGELLRERYGQDAFVVFAGPCIAKLDEAAGSDSQIDAALTFPQLKALFAYKSSVAQSTSLADSFLSKQIGTSRFFPIKGGVIRSFMVGDETDIDIFSVSGIEDCMEVFEDIASGVIRPRFVEAMACKGGCIGGPAMGVTQCKPIKRKRVVQYAMGEAPAGSSDQFDAIAAYWLRDYRKTFTPNPFTARIPSEGQIREILRHIGKLTPADEKNCGACGYNTCRDKAIATFQGLAEPEMCVPYMRSKAESFANLIVDNSANAILVVDNSMIVQEFNPSAEAMFRVDRETMIGRSLATLIDCSDFMKAAVSGDKATRAGVAYPRYNIITEQIMIPVKEHELVIGIISDVTENEARRQELAQLKKDTVGKATEIINKQMQVAQEIAGLLGETTAETKSALLELITVLNTKGEVR